MQIETNSKDVGMKVIFATNNEGKIREIRAIMSDLGIEVMTMKEAGIDVEIVEDGKTFEENAFIKAQTVANVCDEIVMADDSGLEIDALNKEPGVYSARYLGENTSYHEKNHTLVRRLENVKMEDRTARYVCAIAAVLPDGRVLETKATKEGVIGYEERGENGFGYDPIFLLPEYGKTTAEIDAELKNQLSHRGKALRLMKEKLQEVL